MLPSKVGSGAWQIQWHLGGRRVNVKNVELSTAIQWEAAGIMSPQAWSAHTINYQLAATLEKHSLLFNQRVVFFRTSFPNSFRISTFTSINVFFATPRVYFCLWGMIHLRRRRAQWGCSSGGGLATLWGGHLERWGWLPGFSAVFTIFSPRLPSNHSGWQQPWMKMCQSFLVV